ncbi:hypothetical protein JCM11491_004308, partial [Sporobolomyces phaffii]
MSTPTASSEPGHLGAPAAAPAAATPPAAALNHAAGPAAAQPSSKQPPQPPLEDQEMLAFGTVADPEILPPPPRDPNAPALPGGASDNGDGPTHPTAGANGTKRSMGTGATAGAPLARAKRPKNVKFSPAKVGKQLARRAAAPGGAGAGEVVLANNDYCDSCGGKGHFLCCEGGCLRSFHFGCLEPPLEIDEVPEESWFCKACRAKAHPPPRLPPGFFSELISNVDKENPKAFQLTQELRQFYKNVAIGLNGEFIDSNEHRPPSRITGRAVGQEDRDGYRLKDKLGKPIICYNCSQAANPQIHRRIISCDFCDQHWHLDCLNPPMTGMPPPTRKWMCPVHSEHVLPKKRIPRQTTVVNLEERGIPNNGDIIVQPQAPERAAPEEYEEMTVNRIRYQVPEQNIILDFWAKVVPPSRRRHLDAKSKRKASSPRKKRGGVAGTGTGYESGNSSPLTDLTSSDDDDDDNDVDMKDAQQQQQQRPPRSSSTARSTPAAAALGPGPTLLDHLALLAEVRYIDLVNGADSAPAARHGSRPPGSSSSTSSSGGPPPPARFPVPTIPPFGTSASGGGGGGVASPTTRTVSPSLSPAPIGSSKGGGGGGGGGGAGLAPQTTTTGPAAAAAAASELTVQSKEDLKALMQVRKLLLSQGQAPGTAKTTMLSFLEGAPIIPKLAFVNNGKSSAWQRPWEGKKDGSRPIPGHGSTPSLGAAAASLPVPDAIAAAKSTAANAAAPAPAIKSEGGGLLAAPQPPPASTGHPISKGRGGEPTSSSSSDKTTTRAPPASTTSPVLSSSSHLIPTPYSSDMPFQLPAFRPPSATPDESPAPAS